MSVHYLMLILIVSPVMKLCVISMCIFFLFIGQKCCMHTVINVPPIRACMRVTCMNPDVDFQMCSVGIFSIFNFDILHHLKTIQNVDVCSIIWLWKYYIFRCLFHFTFLTFIFRDVCWLYCYFQYPTWGFRKTYLQIFLFSFIFNFCRAKIHWHYVLYKCSIWLVKISVHQNSYLENRTTSVHNSKAAF